METLASRELAHLSNVEYFREMTRRSGGRVLDAQGLTCVASPHEDVHLLNSAFATDREFPAEGVLDQALEFFSQAGRRFSFHALADRDDDLAEQALGLGFTNGGEADPLQLRMAAPVEVAVPPGLELRQVNDPQGVADLTAVCQDAHRHYGFAEDMFPTLYARPALAIGPPLRAWVGYEEDRPVATGTIFLTHGVAYLGWIATVRDRGRSGLGSTITAWLIQRAQELGAPATVLVASPMGAAVYRRLGFVDVGGLRSFLAPG